jgi:hypothetical protein
MDDLDKVHVELDAALKTIAKLLKDLADKNEKVKHLEEMLKRAPLPVMPPPQKLIDKPTVEGEIADVQLERLRDASRSRTLTLEETRMYDLLVKNKRLAAEQSTVNLSKGSYKDLPDIELMKLVGPPETPDKQ